MNDKEFDEIMRKALTPEIEENEIKFLKKTEVRTMKKSTIIKPAIALAACAALVLGVSKVPNFPWNTSKPAGKKEGGIMEMLDHSFTMKVLAAEKQDGTNKKEEVLLKKNVPVVVSCNSDDYVRGGNPKTKETDYCISAPLVCEGEHIETITYTINKGAFQIFSKKGSGFILDGKKCKAYNVGMISPKGYDIEDEEGRIGTDFDEGYYTSYTVSPDFQHSENTQVSICNVVKTSQKTYDLLWDFEHGTCEKLKQGMDEIFGDLAITCEVTYKDGTKSSVEIAVGNAIVTAGEAGISAKKPNEKFVVTTFQMK